MASLVHAGFQLDHRTGLAALSLSEADGEALARALAGLVYDGGSDRYVREVRRRVWGFPEPLLELFDELHNGRLQVAALHVSGLPHEAIAAAPAPGEAPRDCKASDLSENLLIAFASLLGEPFAMAREASELVSQIVPKAADQFVYSGTGSQLPLGFHVEESVFRVAVPGFDLAPSWLLLHGLVAPPDGPVTQVSCARRAAARLDRADEQRLRDARYRFALPVRQQVAGWEGWLSPAAPVLAGPRSAELCAASLYSGMMQVDDPRDRAALAAFEGALEAGAAGVRVEPGTLLAVNNSHALHARDSFVPRFDASQRPNRWLQRVFVSSRFDQLVEVGARAGRERIFDLVRPTLLGRAA